MAETMIKSNTSTIFAKYGKQKLTSDASLKFKKKLDDNLGIYILWHTC